ncbi:MAG: UMP kinase [Candidatus Anstonellales archaeon]
MSWVVISLGGSVINATGTPNTEFLKEFAKMLKPIKRNVAVVCGGGKIARDYIKAIISLGKNYFAADRIAIEETRKNAMLVQEAIGSACYPNVVTSYEEALLASSKYSRLVMGGMVPGITTDACAAVLAEALHAERLVNVSNIDGVYTSDPKKDKNAKRIKEMTHEKMVKMAIEQDLRRAGEHFVFDLLACKIAERSNIELRFVDSKIGAIKDAIEGKSAGTTVKG